MDPPPSNHHDDYDGELSDAIDHCNTLSFNPTSDDSPEASLVSSDPINSQPHPSSPITTTIRRRKSCRVSPSEESLDSSTVNSESDLIIGAKTSFQNRNLKISREDDKLAQIPDSDDDAASILTEKSDLKDDASSNLVEIRDSKNITDSSIAEKHGLKDNAALNLVEVRDSMDDATSNLVAKHNSKNNAATNFAEKQDFNYNAASNLIVKHDLKDHTASNLAEKCILDNDAASNLVEEHDLKDNAALNLADKCDSKYDAALNFTDNNKGSSSSTVTTATNDDVAGDSANTALQLGDSSLSPLELIASLVIKATEFQIKLFIMFVTYPILFMFHCCMFFVDPFGTMRKSLAFLVGIFGKVWGVVSWCISPFVDRLFKEKDSIWSVAFRCGWGFLWSIYVCSILFGLLVSSFVFSGFLMKFLVEKTIQIREVLNFDYTKHSPVAYVPIISCAGVFDATKDSENEIPVSKFVGERVIPSKHKVQVGVSLRVPESGYNRNLGVFQARVDFLLSNGKTIASSSQPCILKFTSEPIHLFMTLLKIVPLVAGYVSETQNLNVKMRGFIEGDVPTSCLRVTLEQRAEYQPGAGIPEIYDASLVIESQLPFFKKIIWLWKLTVYIWIAMIAFVMELILVLVCYRPIIFPRIRQRSGHARGSANLNNFHVTKLRLFLNQTSLAW